MYKRLRIPQILGYGMSMRTSALAVCTRPNFRRSVVFLRCENLAGDEATSSPTLNAKYPYISDLNSWALPELVVSCEGSA